MPPRRPRFEACFSHSSMKDLFLFFLGQNVIHFVSVASYGKANWEDKLRFFIQLDRGLILFIMMDLRRLWLNWLGHVHAIKTI